MSAGAPDDAALERVFAALEADPRAEPAALAARLGVGEEVVRRCAAARAVLSTRGSDTPRAAREGGPWLPRPGDELGSYRLVDVLGRGGMGQVWRAQDLHGGREVAIKLALGARPSPMTLARLAREAEVAASLRHPGLVAVHAAGQARGTPYVVMELVEGARGLEQVLPGLPLAARVALVRDAARALGHAHRQGVVHRDVKPQNLLVDAAGRVRVADFGLALAEGQERLTRTGAAAGTPTHMAPEQLVGGALGPATDVWALGVVLYQAACGALPFDPEQGALALAASIHRGEPTPPGARAAGVPPALDAICARALARDPRRRHADGEVLAEDLDRLLRGEQPAPRPGAARRAAWLLLLGAGAALGAWGLARGAAPEGPAPGVAAPARAELRLGGVVLVLPPDGSELAALAAPLEGWVEGREWSVFVCPSADPAEAVRLTSESGRVTWALPLAPGPNVLQITASGPAGAQTVVRWRLRRAGPAAPPAPPVAPPEPPAQLRPGERPGEWLGLDGSLLVWVPPGTFAMGREAEDAPEEGPSRFVRLTRGLFLGRHEVTWGQYRRFCQEVGRAPPAPAHEVGEVGERHPVHGVGLDDALAYCGWAELRLPSEAEWEWAARGPEGRRFPWGDDPDPSRANAAGAGDGFAATSPVGAFPRGATPLGLLDLAGNVEELVSDGYVARHDPLHVVDPQGSPASALECVRGGAWDRPLARCAATARGARREGAPGAVGFRVAW